MPTVPVDPMYANCVLHLPFDGVDNSTAILDRSFQQNVITVRGAAKIVTTETRDGRSVGYFDGTTDTRLSVAANVRFSVGTGSYWVRAWVKLPEFPSVIKHLLTFTNEDSSNLDGHRLAVDSLGKLAVLKAGSTVVSYGAAAPLNSWFEVAYGRVEGVVYLAINRVLIGVGRSTESLSSSGMAVAVNYNPSGGPLMCYMQDLQVYVGSFPLNKVFEVPIAAFPESGGFWASTVLAMHMDGQIQFRDLKKHVVTGVGNAAVTTGQSRLPGGVSFTFDGNGDYLTSISAPDLYLGDRDYTVEASVRFTGWPVDNGGTYAFTIICKDVEGSREFTVSVTGTASSLTSLQVTSFGSNVVYDTVVGAYTFSLGVWYDLAVSKKNGRTYVFVNGGLLNAGGTETSKSVQATSTPLKIGANVYNATSLYYLNGQVSCVRLTIGEGRYTGNYVVSLPFPETVVGDPHWYKVVLSLTTAAPSGVTTFVDVKGHTVTPQGDAEFSADSAFGEAAAKFTSSGKLVSTSNDFLLGAGNFCLRFWYKLDSLPGSSAALLCMGDAANYWQLLMGDGGFKVKVGINSISSDVCNFVYSHNTNRHYFVWQKVGGLNIFIQDGVIIGGFYHEDFSFVTVGTLYIGANYNVGTTTPCKIDELEIIKNSPYDLSLYALGVTPEILTLGQCLASSVLDTDIVVPTFTPPADVQLIALDDHHTRNMLCGGSGRIYGTVRVGGVLATRDVRLYDKLTGALVHQVWSNSAGDYEFPNLDTTRKFLVAGHDYNQVYNAGVADHMVPE